MKDVGGRRRIKRSFASVESKAQVEALRSVYRQVLSSGQTSWKQGNPTLMSMRRKLLLGLESRYSVEVGCGFCDFEITVGISWRVTPSDRFVGTFVDRRTDMTFS